MEEQKKTEIPKDSFTYLFNQSSFALYSEKLKLNHEIIYKIYTCSSHFSNSIENFSISNQNYAITFEEEEEEKYIKINFYKDGKLIECQYEILKTPYEIHFENIDEIKDKNMYIFKEEAYQNLYLFLGTKKDKYELVENQITKSISIKNKVFKIKEEIINIASEKNSKIIELEDFKVRTIKINPLSLSSNFYSIFNEVEQNKDFIFILNKERIEFFNRLNDFLNSEKLFYYITGSDGIGKSLSLLYYSSLTKHRFLYFNIKLYFKQEDDQKFRNYFYNDLHKFLLYKYHKKDRNYINYQYNNFIKGIENYVNSEKNYEIKGIGKLYKYILGFLNACPGNDFTIILDQYKSDLSDVDYIGLNSLIEFILNNKKAFRIKLIISSSVDNTSNKYVLLRNLSPIYLDLNPSNLSKLLLNENLDNINLNNNENIITTDKQNSKINDKLNNKKDCDFCENIFKRESEKKKIALKKENDNSYYSSGSKCLIDKYFEYTMKDYFFSLTNAKKICENNFSEDELIMAEMFNFSLKYIIKYLNLKSKTKKDEKENDKDYVKRVIRLFYEKVSAKMKSKIDYFYEDLFKKNDKNSEYSNYVHMEFQSLCMLRNYIFYEKKFIMSDLAQQLLLFPMKYLQIVINDYDAFSFPLRTMDLNYSFKLEYNNNFTRILINRIIEEIFKNTTKVCMNSFKGSAESTFLELKIDELFRNNSSHVFDLKDLECRYLFSLVSKTDNSDLTIKKHRKEEVDLIFFGKDSYNRINIDDIDDDKKKLKKEHYTLNKEYYYFSQVSLTGKAFDMCILVKENDNTYKLYLFQVSKSKSDELFTKLFYIESAEKVAENLANLYKINISGRHLIFILPKLNYNPQFLETLKFNDFCYIFFDIDTNEFYNNRNERINKFDFPGSFLDIKLINEDLDYKKINNNFIIWQDSMKAFINKKRNSEKKLCDIYNNKFYYTNKNKLVKLDLSGINNLILDNIIKDKRAILKFIGNCAIKNRKEIRSIHRMIFIFKKDEEIYVDYETLYKLKKEKNSFKLEKMNENEKDFDSIELGLDETAIKNIPSPSDLYTVIKLNDLKREKKYENKCFCYMVITEKILIQFYNWWC